MVQGDVYEYIDIYLSRLEHRRVSNVPDLAEGRNWVLGGVAMGRTVTAEADQADAAM